MLGHWWGWGGRALTHTGFRTPSPNIFGAICFLSAVYMGDEEMKSRGNQTTNIITPESIRTEDKRRR